jgi:hypothetical protein
VVDGRVWVCRHDQQVNVFRHEHEGGELYLTFFAGLIDATG